jgi:hypothetical protein
VSCGCGKGCPPIPSAGCEPARSTSGILWLIREPDLAVGPEVHTEELVLAVAADHRLAGQDRVEMEDLGDYPVLFLDDPIPY